MSGAEQVSGMGNGPKRKKRIFGRLLLVGIMLALIVASSYISYKYTIGSNVRKDESVPSIDPENGIAFEVPKGATTNSIANLLKENGIINYPYLFRLLSRMNGFDGNYKSGTHVIAKELNYDQLMRVLTSKPVAVRVMIPEGASFIQISDAYSSKKLIDKDRFLETANNEKFDFKFLDNLPKRECRLEGYLFPDTYDFDLKAGEKEIIKRMLTRFDEIFKPEYYEKASKLKMTPDQIVILASIIEKEARNPAERPKIAGVFYNRLNSRDVSLRRLQSCATIQYIIFKRDGKFKDKLMENDTKIKDPYNTYENEGLPPGPICSPGKASIEAALNPEKNDYYYFVAKGDGSHYFSRTLNEHINATIRYGVN